MRLAVFTDSGCGGALMNVSVSLASGLALIGHRVDLVTVNEDAAQVAAHYPHVSGLSDVRVFSLAARSARTSLAGLARFLRVQRPQALFSQLLRCNVVAVIARRLASPRTHTILIEGTILSAAAASGAPGLGAVRFARPLVFLSYRWADAIIAKSPDTLTDLTAQMGGIPGHIAVRELPNAYPIGRIRTLAREPVAWPWHDRPTAPVLVAVGRLDRQKGFDTLLSAFAQISRQCPCRLALLGQGAELESLQRQARSLGVADDVWIPGRVPNPWKYMRAARAFVLPSRWEGWSSALSEAAILGCPIVASQSALSGTGWLEDGEHALVVPTNDPEALGEALRQVLTRPELCARLGEGAALRAAAWDHRTVAREYAALAAQLIFAPRLIPDPRATAQSARAAS